jgi:hypothetical protein
MARDSRTVPWVSPNRFLGAQGTEIARVHLRLLTPPPKLPRAFKLVSVARISIRQGGVPRTSLFAALAEARRPSLREHRLPCGRVPLFGCRFEIAESEFRDLLCFSASSQFPDSAWSCA